MNATELRPGDRVRLRGRYGPLLKFVRRDIENGSGPVNVFSTLTGVIGFADDFVGECLEIVRHSEVA